MSTKKVKPTHGLGTIVNHVGEGGHDKHAHLMPIYQTSTFGFDTLEEVLYSGLPDNPYHELASRQMINGYGGMVSFKIKGGVEKGMAFTNAVTIPTLAVSLGNVDSLIQHPASMTHSATPKAEREKAGITDNINRLSVGIENIEDLIEDLDNALKQVS